jgi:pimeloyl-ACP methyl ester carboxylesterase
MTDSSFPEPHDQWIATPRGRLFARIWGPLRTGDVAGVAPIVLLHDSLGSVELWRSFPKHLAETTGRRVIAYDRLGFGRSDAYRGTWTANFHRDEATLIFPLVCEHLHVTRFVVMGHSVGGAMAAICAGSYPDRCQALISESAQAFVEDRTLEGVRAAQENFKREDQLARVTRHHGDKARWVLEAWTASWLSPQFASWTLDAELSAVRCPTLVIHGVNDEFGSSAHPRRIAEGVSGVSQLEILPDCGHVPHREKEPLVLDLIGRFLGALP